MSRYATTFATTDHAQVRAGDCFVLCFLRTLFRTELPARSVLRQGFNWNDGFAGNNTVAGNLVFNMVSTPPNISINEVLSPCVALLPFVSGR